MQYDCISIALAFPKLMILGQVELEDRFQIIVRYQWQCIETVYAIGCPFLISPNCQIIAPKSLLTKSAELNHLKCNQRIVC